MLNNFVIENSVKSNMIFWKEIGCILGIVGKYII